MLMPNIERVQCDLIWVGIDGPASPAASGVEVEPGLVVSPQITVTGKVINHYIDPYKNPTGRLWEKGSLMEHLGLQVSTIITRKINPKNNPISVPITHCTINPNILRPDIGWQRYEIMDDPAEGKPTPLNPSKLGTPALVGFVEYMPGPEEPYVMKPEGQAQVPGNILSTYRIANPDGEHSPRVSLAAVRPLATIATQNASGIETQLTYTPGIASGPFFIARRLP